MFPVCVGLQRIPLLIELELCVLVEFDVIIELTMVVIHRIAPVPADVLRPIRPLLLIEKALQRHEKRIVIQPPAILADEALIAGILGDPAALIGLAQQWKAVGVHLVVVHMLGVMTKVHGFDFLPEQHAFLHQSVQVDVIGIARKSGKGLIGAVFGLVVVGRIERQDLPIGLPCLRQKIHKCIGGLSQVTNAVRPWQTGHRHQYSRFTTHVNSSQAL